MWEFLRHLFSPEFPAHGSSYFWRPGIVGLHVTSDLLLALASFSIPASLLTLLQRRPDWAFPRFFLLLSAFLLSCGVTHLINILVIWQPVYRLEGAFKLLTAVLSVATAFVLVRLLPQMTALPSPAELRATNDALEHQVQEGKEAERRVREANAALEERVHQRTAALERVQQDLGSFSQAASYELREPLRQVAEATRLLEQRYRGRLGDEADKYIQHALRGTLQMQRLLDELVRYSRVDSTELRLQQVEAKAVVAEVLHQLHLRIRESGAMISAENLPRLRTDPTALTYLLQNLIANAIQYRSVDPPRIVVTAQKQASAWLFAVSDNGRGIDAADQEEIFLPLTRLPGQGTPGTGLGLATCRRLVTKLGGRLWVESQPGEGATFFFTLPLAGEPGLDRQAVVSKPGL